jgi:hypothetical protein
VDTHFQQRTRNTSRAIESAAWWAVTDMTVNPAGGLYYVLRDRAQRPAEVRDDRRRTVLEAFASLPMDAMGTRLLEYRRSLKGVEGAAFQQEPALTALAEFHSFVRTFGPIGIGWGTRFEVRNPEADRLKRHAEMDQWQALGRDLSRFGMWSTSGRTEFSTVDFWGHGPGRRALSPAVHRSRSFGDLPWAERVRLGDNDLPHDFWPAIAEEQRDLVRTLELVEAIARQDRFECRRAVRAFASSDDPELRIDSASPSGVGLGAALQSPPPSNGVVRLFRLPEHQVDWILVGKITLADLIARQLDFAMPMVGVAPTTRLRFRLDTTSLLEVIYLELLEHVTAREGFGVGRCGYCKGQILRTRRAGGTGNRWHAGCRSGRVIEWRRAHPNRRSSRRGVASRS